MVVGTVGAVTVDDGGVVVVAARSDEVVVDSSAADVDGEVALDDESPDPHPTRTAATIAPTTRRLDCRVPRRRDRCRDTATSLPERCDDATPTATLMTRVSHHQGTSARARGLQQVEDLGFLAPTGPLALFVSSGVFAVGLRSGCPLSA
jgi:hypothetical protein